MGGSKVTTKFRVETVMTTSIHLRMNRAWAEAELSNAWYYTTNVKKKQALFEKKFANFQKIFRKDLQGFSENNLTKRKVCGIILVFGFSPIWGH